MKRDMKIMLREMAMRVPPKAYARVTEAGITLMRLRLPLVTDFLIRTLSTVIFP